MSTSNNMGAPWKLSSETRKLQNDTVWYYICAAQNSENIVCCLCYTHVVKVWKHTGDQYITEWVWSFCSTHNTSFLKKKNHNWNLKQILQSWYLLNLGVGIYGDCSFTFFFTFFINVMYWCYVTNSYVTISLFKNVLKISTWIELWQQ